MTYRARLGLLLVALFLAAGPQLGYAQWTVNGVPVCDAVNDQSDPRIVSDGAEGAIVTWSDGRAAVLELSSGNISNGGTYAHTFTIAGVYLYHCQIHGQGMAGSVTVAAGQPAAAAVSIANNFYNPSSVSVAPGGTVTWTNNGSLHTVTSDAPTNNRDIYAQRVLASGVVDPAWTANGTPLCNAANDQFAPQIVSDGAGGAIVTWWDRRSGTNTDLYAQHVLASGVVDPAWTANGTLLCNAANDQSYPVMVSDGAGGAIVTWTDLRSGTNLDIYAQRVLASGVADPAWTANGTLLCNAANDQDIVRIVSDGAGGAIVTWQDIGTTDDIYAQRVLASGVVDPAWTANGTLLCNAANDQAEPEIVSDGAGGAIVTWQDSRSGTRDIYAQHVLASGVVDPSWAANGTLLCNAADFLEWGAIVSDGAGGAIVTWNDRRSGNYDPYAQRVLASGVVDPAWTANGTLLCNAANIQIVHEIVSDGAQGAIVAWYDSRSGTSDDIYAQRVLASGVVDPAWTANGNVLCDAANNQNDPAIVSDGVGGAIITWTDRRSGTNSDIYATRLHSDGTPTLASLVSAEAEPDRVRLTWFTPDGAGFIATVYRRTVGSEWVEIARVTADGGGRIAFEDCDVIAGTRYGYRLGLPDGTREAYVGDVWVDVPAALTFALESVRPNPTPGELTVSFSLPSAKSTSLELFDVSGRRLMSRFFPSPRAGNHVVNFGDAKTLPSGCYILRLTQGSRSSIANAVILR